MAMIRSRNLTSHDLQPRRCSRGPLSRIVNRYGPKFQQLATPKLKQAAQARALDDSGASQPAANSEAVLAQ